MIIFVTLFVGCSQRNLFAKLLKHLQHDEGTDQEEEKIFSVNIDQISILSFSLYAQELVMSPMPLSIAFKIHDHKWRDEISTENFRTSLALENMIMAAFMHQV